MTEDRRCGTCARGFYRDNGFVACGAPVDDDAILGGSGVNPIWAERKYNLDRIGVLAAALARAQKGLPPDDESDARAVHEPEGSDAGCMHPNDGAACKMWKAHPELAGPEENWRDFTMVASPYQQQISDSGKRRHRPLSLRLGGRRRDMIDFAQDEDAGGWRPGPAPN